MKAKDSSVNLRLPKELLDAVRGRAKLVGIPYQRFIRLALERALQDPNWAASDQNIRVRGFVGEPRPPSVEPGCARLRVAAGKHIVKIFPIYGNRAVLCFPFEKASASKAKSRNGDASRARKKEANPNDPQAIEMLENREIR